MIVWGNGKNGFEVTMQSLFKRPNPFMYEKDIVVLLSPL